MGKKKDKEAEVCSALPVEAEFVPDTQPVIIESEEEKLDSGVVRKRIVEIKDVIGKSYTELCKLIRHVQLKQLYINWGYPTFKEYVGKELDLKPTKALYLAALWKTLHEKQDHEVFEKVMALGWSKAKELARVVTKENVDAWVEKARHLGVDALNKEVKAELSRLVPDDPKEAVAMESQVVGTPAEEQSKTMTFTFGYNDYLTLSQALDVAGAANPELSKGSLLALICGEFLGTDCGEKGRDHGVALLSRVGKIHNLTVMAVDRQQNDFVLGLEEFREIVKNTLEKQSETPSLEQELIEQL